MILIKIFLIIAAACLFIALMRYKKSFQTLISGIKEGLRGCGFFIAKRRYPIELYQLTSEETDEDEMCDDCLEAIDWDPMDIADWMKEGFPKTPEPYSKCHGECHCQLTLYKPSYSSKP